MGNHRTLPIAELPHHIALGSPYLYGLTTRHPDYFSRVVSCEPEPLLAELCIKLNDASFIEDETAFMATLRQLKAQAALLIAVADLGGNWTLDQVTAGLSKFADAALASVINFVLQTGQRAGAITQLDDINPALNCGYVALAMGKHGAHELNYSSDIDLIILYDPTREILRAGIEPSIYFVKLTKKLVFLLQEITEDGYVFRVDLRLRPDPRATQVAISLEAAANYYETLGQNWERAAMIKARPAAGDLVLGQEFLARMVPYIWRKYLDFAAIADVQSLKRQIHAVKGHGEIAVLGHNLKLGRGGIREIEFFVQTQQLIAGGRNVTLRGKQTIEMLDALASAQWITPQAAIELQNAYRFLRTIEHRIQMVDDEQTHNLPLDVVKFDRLSVFSGFADPAEFAQKIRTTLELVQHHYAALFSDAADLGDADGNLVFTGGEDDPGTLETLTRLGFAQASEVSATIRGWHFSRYAATRSPKSREILTELMPAILQSLARNGDADQAFLAFDRFLAKLPSGVQLFSMLKATPKLLDLIAMILSIAPRLAEQLSSQPRILEGVLDARFFGPLPRPEETQYLIDEMIPVGLALDEVVDRIRVLGREQIFRVGVRILTETLDAQDAGSGFSQLAELLLTRLHGAVAEDMAAKHGVIKSGRSAIIAMGKLGGREMTAGSDLDLVLIYDADENDTSSDGTKVLSTNQYYAKFTQRLISSVTAPTSEGVLYDVDMRLRPSGNKGPVAASFASFVDYQRNSAWTWEKMALTRARVICGDESLARAITAEIADLLAAPRTQHIIKKDVHDMRQLMVRELGSDGIWDIKRVRGGMVDIEFIVQYLVLVHAAEFPDLRKTNIEKSITQLAEFSLLQQNAARTLLEAWLVYGKITQVLRLCVVGKFIPEASSAGLRATVSRAAGMPDITATLSILEAMQGEVAQVFDEIIGKA